MIPMPLDFMEYLSDRLGLPESAVNAMLGAWLKEYEPTPDPTFCLGPERRSGVPGAPPEVPASEPRALARSA